MKVSTSLSVLTQRMTAIRIVRLAKDTAKHGLRPLPTTRYSASFSHHINYESSSPTSKTVRISFFMWLTQTESGRNSRSDSFFVSRKPHAKRVVFLIQKAEAKLTLLRRGPSWGIRTPDRRNRNPVLYPAELKTDTCVMISYRQKNVKSFCKNILILLTKISPARIIFTVAKDLKHNQRAEV